MGPTARARLSRRARACLAGEGGFTLVELLIAMVILLIVIGSLATVLVSATRTEVDANKRFQAQEQARSSLTQLVRELHCAKSVTVMKNGSAVGPGVAGDAINATLPSTCSTSGGIILYVTWCTSTSTLRTGDYALYRVTATATPFPTCTSAGKVKWADYLTTQTPFCLPGTTVLTACGGVQQPQTSSLPLLHVTMPVNLNGPPPASTIESYNLVDDIALRNGTRP